jgi:hypothetical protein
MTQPRGLKLHFNDGSSLTLSFPMQRENDAARALMAEEILKRRMLTVEADGGLMIIPFESIKYFTVYPVGQALPKATVRGATVTG